MGDEAVPCQAQVNGRPCKKNARGPNGYCASHQNLAVAAVLRKLVELKRELKRLSSQPEAEKNAAEIQRARDRITSAQEALKEAKSLCSSDSECAQKLRDASASVLDVTSSTEGGDEKLESIRREADRLVMDRGGPDAEAVVLSREWASATGRKEVASKELKEVKRRSGEVTAKMNRLRRDHEVQVESLKSQMKANEKNQQQANETIRRLQEKLQQCGASSMTATGELTERLEKLHQSAEQYKNMYDEMKARELQLSKNIDLLSQEQVGLQEAVVQLRQKHKQQLREMQREFAEQVVEGHPVSSQKEHELANEVERLRQQLAQAEELATKSHEAGQSVLQQVQDMDDSPQGEIARELIRANETIAQRTSQLQEVQRQLDEARAKFANGAYDCALETDKSVRRVQQEMEAANHRIADLEQQAAEKTRSIINAREQWRGLRTRLEKENRLLSERIHLRTQELNQVRRSLQEEINARRSREQIMQRTLQVKERDLNSRFMDLKNTLEGQYRVRKGELESAAQQVREQLHQAKRDMESSSVRARQLQAEYGQRLNRLQAAKKQHDAEVSRFNQEKEVLQMKVQQAQEQSRTYTEMEQAHIRRMDLMNQRLTMTQNRYQAELRALKARTVHLQRGKEQAESKLQQCESKREAMQTNINLLREENDRIKMQYQELRHKIGAMKLHYETHMEKLRGHAAEMETDLKRCSDRLRDASLVHSHVEKMKRDAQQLRADLQQKIKYAESNEAAFRRLMTDHRRSKENVQQMGHSLQQCAKEKERLQRRLEHTNRQVRAMNRLSSTLNGELTTIRSQYRHAAESREAAMHRQRLESERRERDLTRKLSRSQHEHHRTLKETERALKDRNDTQRALADTEVNHAVQVTRLAEAQRVRGKGREPLLGRSVLE